MLCLRGHIAHRIDKKQPHTLVLTWKKLLHKSKDKETHARMFITVLFVIAGTETLNLLNRSFSWDLVD